MKPNPHSTKGGNRQGFFWRIWLPAFFIPERNPKRLNSQKKGNSYVEFQFQEKKPEDVKLGMSSPSVDCPAQPSACSFGLALPLCSLFSVPFGGHSSDTSAVTTATSVPGVGAEEGNAPQFDHRGVEGAKNGRSGAITGKGKRRRKWHSDCFLLWRSWKLFPPQDTEFSDMESLPTLVCLSGPGWHVFGGGRTFGGKTSLFILGT